MSRLVAVALSALLVAGCTTKAELEAADPAGPATAGGVSREASPRNGADEAYVRDLGVLHEQAVDLAELARRSEPSAAVAALSEQVFATRMRWLVPLDSLRGAWAVERHEPGFRVIPGELTAQELAELSELDGAELERQWLARLTANYRASLALSEDELLRGRSPEGRGYAEQVIVDLRTDLEALERHADG